MELTEHFTLDELTITQHRGIDNTPNDRELYNLRKLAEHLEVIRSLLGNKPLLISSAFRCQNLNRAIGSKDSSAHVLGLAADFICPKFGTVEEVFELLRRTQELKFDQLILEFVNGKKWIHFGLREDEKDYRRQSLLIDHNGTRVV